MIMSYETYVERTAKLLNGYNYSTVYFNKFTEKCELQKKRLNDLFGLTKENNFRKIIPYKATDNDIVSQHDILIDIITSYFHRIDVSVVKYNWANNMVTLEDNKTMKLTKFISKHDSLIERIADRYFGCSTSQVLPKLGEIFTGTSDWNIVLSTNVFDYITNSAEGAGFAAFGTCFDITEENDNTKSGYGGCHTNGGNAYAMDDFTLLCYVATSDNLDRKCGRGWLHVPPVKKDMPMVCLSGLYGKMNCNKVMTTSILASVGKILNSSDSWNVDKLQEYPWEFENAGCIQPNSDEHNEFAVYFNGYDYEIYIMYQGTRYISDLPNYALTFSDAMCLECGRMTNYNLNMSCSSCDKKTYTCYYCGSEHHENTEDELGHNYCDICTRTECADCGESHSRYDMYAFEGKLYCYYHVPSRCDFCNQIVLRSSVQYVLDRSNQRYGDACPECQKRILQMNNETEPQMSETASPPMHNMAYQSLDEIITSLQEGGI